MPPGHDHLNNNRSEFGKNEVTVEIADKLPRPCHYLLIKSRMFIIAEISLDGQMVSGHDRYCQLLV